MLLIDGVKYEVWTPPSEAHFEQIVKEHAPDIFGEQSIYFDIKQKLKAKSGVGSIPDGYAIILSGIPQWYIVEVELSSHPVFEHIVSQMHKFMAGIKNSRKEIADTLYEEISKSQALKAMVESKTKSSEIYRFLDSLVSKPPKLAIIIEEETEELREAVEGIRLEIRIVEFKTFVREADISQHAHIFEPLGVPSQGELLEELRGRFIERPPKFGRSNVYSEMSLPTQILELLKTEGRPMTRNEMATILEAKQDSIKRSLTRLRDSGKVIKLGNREWGLVYSCEAVK
jgi:hypothetical protein